MPIPLYLDIARLGPFNKKAQATHASFLRLVGDVPTAPAIIPFLREGASAWHDQDSIAESELCDWRGIQSLETALVRPFGNTNHPRVYLASRSTALIRLGIEQLFKSCRRCLTIDLSWPSYLLDLQHIANRSGSDIVIAPIRRAILNEQINVADVCELLYRTYYENRCDGLFLPIVDHLGVRIPVAPIVDTLRRRGCEVRFVLLDAAQAYAHVPMAEDVAVADFVVAGTHKWLGSYFPLGMALSLNAATCRALDTTIANAVQHSLLDDALLTFIGQLNGNGCPRSETVNLGPIFSAFGAISDISPSIACSLDNRLANAELVSKLATSTGWSAIRPQSDFRSGILLLQPPQNWICSQSRIAIEHRFLEESVYVTVYDSGLVRLAMPGDRLTNCEVDRLSRVFSMLQAQAPLPFNGIREAFPSYELDCLPAS